MESSVFVYLEETVNINHLLPNFLASLITFSHKRILRYCKFLIT